MIGTQVKTKNIRRQGIPASKGGVPNPEYVKSAVGPTLERLEKADGFYVVGNETRGAPIHTMRDNPLERLFARRLLSGTEYAALQKYHHHWHCAGLEASLGSVDLNRIFSSDPGSMSGMAKSLSQAHHRRQWREAREVIGRKTGMVVDSVVCAGTQLEAAGHAIGYTSPYRARESALRHIQRAGDMLERHWGLR